MITPEQHAEIRRLYYGEHWKVGTIAAALGVLHNTVRAAIAHDTQGVRRGTCRATKLDPYLPVIRDTLAHYPRLRATRLFEMVKARGYTGSVVQLRRAVRLIRPAATATVYRRLTTLAAEDYGESAVMVSPEELTDHDGVARARATSQKPTKLVPTRWRRDPWWYQLTGTPMPEGKVLAFPKPKRAER